MDYMVTSYIILYNMIIEMRCDGITDVIHDPYGTDSQRSAEAGLSAIVKLPHRLQLSL
jgi:hypothetical protein